MSYRPDFSGCWAKIGRAKEHRDTLEDEVGIISGEDAISEEGANVPPNNWIDVSLSYDHQSGDYVARSKEAFSEERLRRWGLITGDVVHNLRGALDHLVWQLALFNCEGDEPENPEQVQFPLYESPSNTSPENFAEGKALKHVAPDHRVIIERYQPYKETGVSGSFTPRPSFWLRKFSNLDKHRIIVSARPICYRTYLNITEIFGEQVRVEDFRDVGYGKLLEPGIELRRFKAVPFTNQQNIYVAGYHKPGICFHYPDYTSSEQPGEPILPLVSAIDLMSGRVEKVICEFETLSY